MIGGQVLCRVHDCHFSPGDGKAPGDHSHIPDWMKNDEDAQGPAIGDRLFKVKGSDKASDAVALNTAGEPLQFGCHPDCPGPKMAKDTRARNKFLASQNRAANAVTVAQIQEREAAFDQKVKDEVARQFAALMANLKPPTPAVEAQVPAV